MIACSDEHAFVSDSCEDHEPIMLNVAPGIRLPRNCRCSIKGSPSHGMSQYFTRPTQPVVATSAGSAPNAKAATAAQLTNTCTEWSQRLYCCRSR